MVNGVDIAVGGVSGAAFGSIFDLIRDVLVNAAEFTTSHTNIKSTLEALQPLMQEIEGKNKTLHLPDEELKGLKEEMEKDGKRLEELSEQSVRNYFMRPFDNMELDEMDKSLQRLLGILQVQTGRDVKEVLVQVNKVSSQLHGCKIDVNKVSSQLDGCKTDVNKISSQLDDCKTEIVDEISAWGGKTLDQLDQVVSNGKETLVQVNKVSRQLDGCKTDVNKVSSQLDGCKTDVNKISSQLDDCKTEIVDGISAWGGKTTDQLDQVASNGKETLVQVNKVSRQLDGYQTDVNKVSSQLDGCKIDVNKISNQLDDCKTEIIEEISKRVLNGPSVVHISEKAVADLMEEEALASSLQIMCYSVREALSKPTLWDIERVLQRIEKNLRGIIKEFEGDAAKTRKLDTVFDEVKWLRKQVENGAELIHKCSKGVEWNLRGTKNRKLDMGFDELKGLRIKVEEGTELIRKCSNVGEWTNHKMVANKLDDLEKFLEAFVQRLKRTNSTMPKGFDTQNSIPCITSSIDCC